MHEMTPITQAADAMRRALALLDGPIAKHFDQCMRTMLDDVKASKPDARCPRDHDFVWARAEEGPHDAFDTRQCPTCMAACNEAWSKNRYLETHPVVPPEPDARCHRGHDFNWAAQAAGEIRSSRPCPHPGCTTRNLEADAKARYREAHPEPVMARCINYSCEAEYDLASAARLIGRNHNCPRCKWANSDEMAIGRYRADHSEPTPAPVSVSASVASGRVVRDTPPVVGVDPAAGESKSAVHVIEIFVLPKDREELNARLRAAYVRSGRGIDGKAPDNAVGGVALSFAVACLRELRTRFSHDQHWDVTRHVMDQFIADLQRRYGNPKETP